MTRQDEPWLTAIVLLLAAAYVVVSLSVLLDKLITIWFE